MDNEPAQRADHLNETFQQEVRSWLREHVPDEPLAPMFTEEGVAQHKRWERALYDAGYAVLGWPREYGGADADMRRQVTFQEEYLRAEAPDRINRLALGLAGPTILAFGTDEQKTRWLPGIASSEQLWCQGFSEPEAGSDLAGLRTTGVRNGDHLVVNGQKVWTSLAIHADWMFSLVRTNLESKHRGISYLMIDMSSPGIEVRPIRQLHGEPGFAEVFLSDVRVPVENVVGEIDDGWRVARATLGFERALALGNHVRYSQEAGELVALAHRLDLADDPQVRDRIAQVFAQTEAFRFHVTDLVDQLADGSLPGAEASLTKLFWSEMEADIYDLALEMLGPLAELSEVADEALSPPRFHRNYWHSRASHIFAGTTEIQKNIIAERILGLPREVTR